MIAGYCPKCGLVKRLTKHHIYPQRFFGKEGPTKLLCRDCHDELELIIPDLIKLSKRRYWEIYYDFLMGVYDEEHKK